MGAQADAEAEQNHMIVPLFNEVAYAFGVYNLKEFEAAFQKAKSDFTTLKEEQYVDSDFLETFKSLELLADYKRDLYVRFSKSNFNSAKRIRKNHIEKRSSVLRSYALLMIEDRHNFPENQLTQKVHNIWKRGLETEESRPIVQEIEQYPSLC